MLARTQRRARQISKPSSDQFGRPDQIHGCPSQLTMWTSECARAALTKPTTLCTKPPRNDDDELDQQDALTFSHDTTQSARLLAVTWMRHAGYVYARGHRQACVLCKSRRASENFQKEPIKLAVSCYVRIGHEESVAAHTVQVSCAAYTSTAVQSNCLAVLLLYVSLESDYHQAIALRRSLNLQTCG